MVAFLRISSNYTLCKKIKNNELELELETVEHVYSFLREYFNHNKDCDKDIN